MLYRFWFLIYSLFKGIQYVCKTDGKQKNSEDIYHHNEKGNPVLSIRQTGYPFFSFHVQYIDYLNQLRPPACIHSPSFGSSA